jgi:hypothetical protein
VARVTTAQRSRNSRASEEHAPFHSLESAQEYIALFRSAIDEARQDIGQDLQIAGKADAARRVDALRLVNYKLNQLQNHMDATGRLLNDLRMLRRLLLDERRLVSPVVE